MDPELLVSIESITISIRIVALFYAASKVCRFFLWLGNEWKG